METTDRVAEWLFVQQSDERPYYGNGSIDGACVTRPGCKVWYRNCSLTAAPSGADIVFEGMSFGDGRIERGPQLGGHAPPLNGRYTQVELAEGRALISTDSIGLGMLFLHRASSGQFAVSNSLPLLARALPNPELDYVEVASALILDGQCSSRTIFRDITVVPRDCYVEVASGELAVKTWPAPDRVELDAVCNELVTNAAASASVENPVLWLTGGFDSRVLLAALIAAGRHQELGYFTYGAETSNDKRIAAALRRRFGLSFAKPRIRTAEAHACIAYNRAHNPMLRTFIAPTWVAGGVTKLNGGCGENFRGVFTRRHRFIAPPGRDATEPISTVDRMFAAFQRWNQFTRTGLRAVRARLEASMVELPYSDDITKVDALYTHYRNRSHFGLGAKLIAQDHEDICPLASIKALQYSFQVDAADRVAALVTKEIIERLCPDLAAIEYADAGNNGPWTTVRAADIGGSEPAPRRYRDPTERTRPPRDGQEAVVAFRAYAKRGLRELESNRELSELVQFGKLAQAADQQLTHVRRVALLVCTMEEFLAPNERASQRSAATPMEAESE